MQHIDSNKSKKHNIHTGTTLRAQSASNQSHSFRKLQSPEFLRVMQNGIRQGSTYLLAGEPGIGKSTLILQILQDLHKHNTIQSAYFSGEENTSQIADRRARLYPDTTCPIELYQSSSLEDIITTVQEQKAPLIIIDSIQTIYAGSVDSSPGSPNQVRFCSEKLSELSKQTGCTIIIIGHVTKSGEIAGPKYLEHIVDVVLYIQGDRFWQFRFLRSQKNRFGHTDDSAIFEMTLFGLQAVYDIKQRILQNANTSAPGSVLGIWLDNGRPVLTNIEVLLNKSKFKFPQRNSIGLDNKRVDLVIAILEKYLHINLWFFDIFVNIPGEFSFNDSGLDLAIAAAIYSQYTNQSLPINYVFIGELALSGQISKSKLHDKRLREVTDSLEAIDYQHSKHIAELKKLF